MNFNSDSRRLDVSGQEGRFRGFARLGKALPRNLRKALTTTGPFLTLFCLVLPVLGQVSEIDLVFPPLYETAGIDFADGLLWVADNYVGPGSEPHFIHLYDPFTGMEVGSVPSAVTTRTNARDLVIVGNSIFQPEDFNSDHHIHQSSKFDGSNILEFAHPGRFPWGIASDGAYLYVLETEFGEIHKRELIAPNYPVVSVIPFPAPRQSGLTFAHGALYYVLTNTGTDSVQRLHPDTGAVLETIPLPPDIVARLSVNDVVVRDIAFDGSHFWFLLADRINGDQLLRAPDGWGIPVQRVLVDIKPSSHPNSLNCRNPHGLIPVGILSTEEFDATSVDHTTVWFEGASEAHVHASTAEIQRHEEDINLDGDPDLVLHFLLAETGLSCASIEGRLTGLTFGSAPIAGSDTLRMVNKGPNVIIVP